MAPGDDRPAAGILLIAAVLVGLGAIATVVVAVSRGLGDATGGLLAGFFAAAAVLVLIGWWRDRRQGHKQRGRIERARHAKREWAAELRRQVLQTHRDRGSLGFTGDVRDLVLKVALDLTKSEKGLLLSRKDEDHDGYFDTICAQGFTNDPTRSAICQEFGAKVLRSDQTLREDDSSVLRARSRNPADEELRNLIAVPIYMQDEFEGVVICANRDGGYAELDEDVLLTLGDHAGTVLENGRLHGLMRDAYMSTVQLLCDALEANDTSVRHHSDEVASHVAAVADRLQLDSGDREELVIASMLHDIGKIGVSERILLKPGPLTPEERAAVELHPRIGFLLLQQVPVLKEIARAVLHHHEHFDGGGYPAGLSGDRIPLAARVIGVADSFSAMTVDRPYRAPMSAEEACAELERCAGSQFDPQVVSIFVEEVHRTLSARATSPHRPLLDDPELRAHLEPGERAFGQGAAGAVDSLTLLYGHRHMHDVVAAQARRAAMGGQPFSVVIVQLTALSLVNERDGHAAGDEAIRVAAHALQRAAHECGGTACRHGGRRLVLIAPQTTYEGGAAVARDLARVLNADQPTAVAAAAAWQAGDTGADVLERARRALARRDAERTPTAF